MGMAMPWMTTAAESSVEDLVCLFYIIGDAACAIGDSGDATSTRSSIGLRERERGAMIRCVVFFFSFNKKEFFD